jgi:hypothetical protein
VNNDRIFSHSSATEPKNDRPTCGVQPMHTAKP